MATLRQALSPLFIMSHILGITAVTATKSGFQRSDGVKIYAMFLILTYLISAGYFGMKDLEKKTASMLIQGTKLVEYMFGYFEVIIIWICAITLQKSHLELLKKFYKIDKMMQKLGVWLFYNDLKKYVFRRVTIHAVFIVLLIASQVATTRHRDFTTHEIVFTVLYYIPIIISFAIVENMGVYTHMIKDRYRHLNAQLEELQSNVEILDIQEDKEIKHKPDSQILSTLRIVCPIHHEVTFAAKLISKVFGNILFITFSVNFIAIMIGCYIICVACQYLDRDIILIVVPQTILGIANHIGNTYYLCNCCHTTVQECNRTGLLIHAIDFESEAVRDEIQSFSMQITHEDLKFTAAGFFTVNYGLLFSIIGGLTTYIIILIQFSTNSGESIKAYYSTEL